MESKGCKCDVCGEEFPSKTKLFRHLAIHGFESKDAKPTKVVLLVGWLSQVMNDHDEWISEQSQENNRLDETSKKVEDDIFRALYMVENNTESIPDGVVIDRPKGFSRGSSTLQRTSIVFGSEASCHGQCDTICFQVKSFATIGKDAWKKKMNDKLPHTITIHEVFVLSTAAAPNFHAESDCTQRRYEYIFPLKYILPVNAELPSEPIVRRRRTHMHSNLPKTSRLGAMDQRFPADTEEGQIRISFFRKMKKIFKDLAGKKKFHNFVTGGAAPADSSVTRKLDRIYHKEILSMDGEDWVVFSISGDSLLKGQVRKLIGLTLAIALDIFPMEYIDDVFEADGIAEIPSVPGWAMYLAECRYACWEAKYLEYRLDPRREENGNTDALDAWTEELHRHIADISRRVGNEWMGKFLQESKSIYARYKVIKPLKNRGQLALENEFGEKFGLEAQQQARKVYEETEAIASEIRAALQKKAEEEAAKKKQEEESKKKATNSDKKVETIENVEDDAVEMSSVVSNEVQGPSGRTGNNLEYQQRVTRLCFIDVPKEKDDVPQLFAKVLHLLREADRSQLWPSSSTGRQQVISTATLLEVGGRGGSFSVGALPKHLVQPKGNIIFPELMKACFLLEKRLLPNRPPSATIAINRHAEFLPHRDSGAGAGQTKSLIVALGAFTGGEIVVDHVPHDIRYRPLEFDGWQSLHYTMPFVGERYSLVWFTPLGLSYEDMWWWNEPDMN